MPTELSKLQSQAPPMGPAFTRRRMKAELGDDWEKKFASFEISSAASASLGQVHKAFSHDGAELACKLQYPDMQSAVEADLNQLDLVFAIHKRMNPAIDTREVSKEFRARLREELDYTAGSRPYGALPEDFRGVNPPIRVPGVVRLNFRPGGCSPWSWLHGRPVLDYKESSQEARNAIARFMFRAWWYPFSHYGVIHGDPHLGNYTVFEDGQRDARRAQPARLWLHADFCTEIRARRDRPLYGPADK